jgi:hypothetical protein
LTWMPVRAERWPSARRPSSCDTTVGPAQRATRRRTALLANAERHRIHVASLFSHVRDLGSVSDSISIAAPIQFAECSSRDWLTPRSDPARRTAAARRLRPRGCAEPPRNEPRAGRCVRSEAASYARDRLGGGLRESASRSFKMTDEHPRGVLSGAPRYQNASAQAPAPALE